MGGRQQYAAAFTSAAIIAGVIAAGTRDGADAKSREFHD